MFCVPAPQNPAVCGETLFQNSWGAGGSQRGAGGCYRGAGWEMAASGGFSCLCCLQSPSTGRRRSAASPPWAATPSGGSGTPQSVSTWAMAPPALHLSRDTQGTLCSLLYCLVTSPATGRWEFGKRPFPVVSKSFSVNFLIVWVQPSAKCYHYIVH